jgi:hypothetical protein
MRTLLKKKKDYIHVKNNQYGYSKYFVEFTEDENVYSIELNEDERNISELMLTKLTDWLNVNNNSYLTSEEYQFLTTSGWIEEQILTDEATRDPNEDII